MNARTPAAQAGSVPNMAITSVTNTYARYTSAFSALEVLYDNILLTYYLINARV